MALMLQILFSPWAFCGYEGLFYKYDTNTLNIDRKEKECLRVALGSCGSRGTGTRVYYQEKDGDRDIGDPRIKGVA